MLSIVIPFYNESDRFDHFKKGISELVNKWTYPIDLVLINDGSIDDTVRLLEEFKQQNQGIKISIVDLKQNSGKGSALISGVEIASGDWILTLDADMSASPLNLIDWFGENNLKDLAENTIYIGSRRHPQSDVLTKNNRKWLGQIFNTYTSLLVPLKHQDTQCGFKLYPAQVAKHLFSKLEVGGWAHDIEILLRANYENIEIVSLPVTWRHIGNEKINVFSDGIKMALETFKISRRLSKEYS